ncbi:hypothetical protein FAGAP_9397 [Fusarium agapanthi]|uniref:Uncharacterized protein n=1 Tax=Fusarium agapanthi TaxID=1803897 RepID=A0A9P5E4G6_9HYPO|nr:hypothetical protein FAGAP_9397 [Fusarium agapanthi]
MESNDENFHQDAYRSKNVGKSDHKISHENDLAVIVYFDRAVDMTRSHRSARWVCMATDAACAKTGPDLVSDRAYKYDPAHPYDRVSGQGLDRGARREDPHPPGRLLMRNVALSRNPSWYQVSS